MRTKTGFLGLVVAGLVIGSLVASGVVRADDAPAKKHHHHHGVHGTITAVASDGTSITIKVHHHAKKGSTEAAPPDEDKTVAISASTKVEIFAEGGTKTTGAISDLKVGTRVSIHDHKGAQTIVIGGHGHHHKKKPAA